MSLLNPAVWLGALVAFALSFGTGYWRGHTAGETSKQGEWDAAKVIQEQVAVVAEAGHRATEQRLQKAVDDANRNRAGRAAIIARDADALRVERDGLRGAIAVARTAADLPGYTLATCRADTATRDDILRTMADVGARIAGAADGHAADEMTIREAWPVNGR